MFQVGKPVKGIQFIGRDKELELLTSYLKIGQSVVLIAPRRFGKTSLLLEALRQLKKEGFYTGSVDIFAHASLSSLSEEVTGEVLQNHGLRTIFNKVKDSAVEMVRNVQIKSVIEDFEFILGFSESGKEEWHQFEESIDFINDFPARHQQKMVFAFDEFGDIQKFEQQQSIIKMLRSKIQKQENVSYIFSGSYESVMQSMFVTSKSPFYRLARIINLSYLEFNALKKYMKSQFKKYELPSDDTLIEDVIDLFKGHPYYCQLALQQIFLIQKIKNKLPNLDQLVDEMLATENSYLEKAWEELASNKENVFLLKHLTTSPKGLYRVARARNINASRALQNLEGRGVIYKESGGYYFYDPLFEIWIGRSISV